MNDFSPNDGPSDSTEELQASHKTMTATPSTPSHKSKRRRKENPLVNIAFNILIPVMLLEKLTIWFDTLTAVHALFIALSFPVGYFVWDYISNKHTNSISILGVVNIVFTGGFALYKLEGIWFSIKEMSFPLLIGIAVFVSAYTSRTAIEMMAYNDNIFRVDLIKQIVSEKRRSDLLSKLLQNSTLLFGVSFLLSAALNFFLAQSIFVDIDPSLSEEAKTAVLNSQVSEMTWKGFLVISLPLLFFLAFILWYLIRGLQRLTGLQMTELMIVSVAESK